jgi:hypothetical protein
MRTLIAVIAVLSLVSLSPAPAEAEGTPEFRLLVGAYVPTGNQADLLGNSMMIGGQVAYELSGSIHLLGTFSYATPENDMPSNTNDVHIYQYDAGAELFQAIDMSNAWTFRPFVGLGLGGRTYDLKNGDSGSQTNGLGYGALGAEFQKGRLAARFEGRDYVSHFDGLNGEDPASTRNDLMFSGGLSFHF